MEKAIEDYIETVEDYIKTLRQKDFKHVTYRDRNDTFDKLNLGIEFGRVEFGDEHYLFIFEDSGEEVRGPFENEDDVNREATDYATEEALSTLTAFYAEITHKQFCLAKKLNLFTVTDLYGQSYVKDEDYADLEEEEEDDE